MKTLSSITALTLAALTTNAFATTYQSTNGYQITPPNGFVYRQGANISFDTGPIHEKNRAFDSLFVGPNKETVSVLVKNSPPQVTLPWLLENIPRFTQSAMNNTDTRISGTFVPNFRGKTKWRVLSKGYTTVGGTQAVTFLSRIEVASSSNAVLARQVTVLRGGWMYTISCTAPAKTFWKLAPGFNSTLKTLRWTR